MAAGGINAQDNSGTITIPETHISKATAYIFSHTQGSTLTLRLAYDRGATVTTSPIVCLFGRTMGSGVAGWQLLRTLDDSPSATLGTAVTDIDDGTVFKFTTPSRTSHTFDKMGCDQFVVGTLTAFAVSSGSAATAIVQAKEY
jgi:hypothetical protein